MDIDDKLELGIKTCGLNPALRSSPVIHHSASPHHNIVGTPLFYLSFCSLVTSVLSFFFSIFFCKLYPLAPTPLPSPSMTGSGGGGQLIWGDILCVFVCVWLVADKTSHSYPPRQTCVDMTVCRTHTNSHTTHRNALQTHMRRLDCALSR